MSEAASVERFLDLASRSLVDSRVGIVRSVTQIASEPGGPGLFQFSTRARGLDGLLIGTGGASASRALALAKAVGEAVERYCAGICDPREIVRASFNHVEFPAVAPKDLAIYTAAQVCQPGFPFSAFEPAIQLGWVAAQDLATGAPVFVPACKVYVPYRPDSEAGEPLLFQSITTGLACHQSFELAAIGAICEVIERDAFMIVWQARIAPPRIRFDSLDDETRQLAERYLLCGDDLGIFNLTLDHGVPTLLTTLRSARAGAPALIVAAASDATPRQALRKCLEELQLMRGFALWVMAKHGRFGGTPEQVLTRDDHVNYYCCEANASHADFLFASSVLQDLDGIESLPAGQPRQTLQALLERIQAIGHRVLVKDITTPDIAPLGLTVVRAIIPGFQPLVFGHHLRALACSRLWTVPQRLGHAGVSAETGDNPAPHPFP